MIVKYNSLNKIERPVLTLCNPGSIYNNGKLSNAIGVLSNHEAEELVFNFNSTSELNFRIDSIPTYAYDDDGASYVSDMFNAVKNKRLIFMDDIGYFVIDDVKDSYENGISYKDVSAKSADIELQQRNVPFIEDGTYPFSTQGSQTGILETIVSSVPLWTIGTVDNSVATKYRTFEDVDTSQNCLAFLINSVQEAYECIIIFDTINREINVYDQDNYVRLTDVHLTKDDLISSCKVTEQSDSLYTAITALGDDDIVISAINPLGSNTIYNFNYYLDWMSSGLRTKVTNWQTKVQSKLTTYYNKQLEYYTKLDSKLNLEMEIEKIDTQISMYQRCLDNIVTPDGKSYVDEYNEAIVASGGTPITIQPEISQMKTQINNLISQCNTTKASKQSQLDTVNSRLSTLSADIQAIQSEVSFGNNFTSAELEELQNYIFEGSYKDEYVVITDEMTNSEQFNQMKVLYDRAKLQLDRVSQPTSEYEVGVESFLFAKEFEHANDQLETGCLINVELSDGDVAELFLSSIKVNFDDYNFSLTFGNRYNKFDSKTLFNKVLGNVSKSANTVNYLKELLRPIKEGEVEKIYTAIQDSRDLTMAQALASDNQEVIIDGSGYTGRMKLQEGVYDPKQIKITGKNIVFTDDAWESCKTAIGEIQLGNNETIYGVNAEALIGNIIMGNELHILDNQGREIFTVVDGKIHSQIQDNNENYVDGHIADSATEVRTYADTQITQTAEKITSEATARLEATVGYSSKNLLEITNTSKIQAGVTFTVNKTAGTITAKNACTADEYTIYTVGSIVNTSNTAMNLYMSGCADGGSTDTYYVYAYDTTTNARPKKWNGTAQSGSSTSSTDKYEIQIPAGHTVQIRILIKTGYPNSTITFKPMVRNGDISDNTFEPYHSVQTQIADANSKIEQTADSITLSVSKRIKATVGHSDENLFVYNKSTQTINGVTFTIDKDAETIKANGTASDDVTFTFTIPSTVYGKLYYSGCADGGSNNSWYIYCWDSTSGEKPKKWDGTTSSSSCFNKDQAEEVKLVSGHTNLFAIKIKSGTKVSNIVFEPSITKNKNLQCDVYNTNSMITQTASDIRLEVSTAKSEAISTAANDATSKANSARSAAAKGASKYNTTGKTIHYYGYGFKETSTPYKTTDTGILASATGMTGKYFLNQTNGKLYKSDGSDWVEHETLTLILDDYSTTTQMNSAIDVKANGITLASAQLVYGSRTKNLIPFVLKSKTLNGITCTRSGTGYKLTGTATSNSYFTLYTTDASVSYKNTKLPNVKTLSNGKYYIKGGTSSGVVVGFDNNIQYRIQYSTDGTTSTESKICYYGESGNVNDTLFEITSTMKYIRHYIWIRSGTDMGTNGTMVYPMIRDEAITNSGYTAGIDAGAYMCSSINLTPEKLELDAGKLIINSGNFQLDENGTVTITSGIIKTSNYEAASGNNKTTGGKINLSARDSTLLFDTANFKITGAGAVTITDLTLTGGTIQSSNFDTTAGTGTKINLSNGVISTGSGKFNVSSAGAVTASAITIKNFDASKTLMSISSSNAYLRSANYSSNSAGMKIDLADGSIDSKNFKVSSDGTVTATGALIKGGRLEVTTVGSDDDSSYINLQSEFNESNTRISRRLTISPKQIIRQVSTYDNGGSSSVLMARSIIKISENGLITLQDTDGSYGKPRVSICPNYISVELPDGNLPHTSIFPDGIYSYDNSSSSSPYTRIVGSSLSTVNLTATTAYISTLNRNSGAISVQKSLAFASGYGINLAGVEAFRMLDNEVAVGIGASEDFPNGLPLRIYASKIYLGAVTYTNTGVVVTSDARRKHDIESLDNRYLDVIKSIEPKRFRYLDNPLDRYHTGYIAQDVKAAMDKLNVGVDELSAFVDINGDGSDLALRYGEMIPLLHKWLKELDSRMTAIEKRKEG